MGGRRREREKERERGREKERERERGREEERGERLPRENFRNLTLSKSDLIPMSVVWNIRQTAKLFKILTLHIHRGTCPRASMSTPDLTMHNMQNVVTWRLHLAD